MALTGRTWSTCRSDAVFLVDVDDAAEFSLSEITLVGGSVLPVAPARVERTNLDRIVGH